MPSQTADTTYVMTVTGSSGLNTFPSFSFYLSCSFYPYGQFDEIKNYISRWDDIKVNSLKTGSLALMQSNSNPENFGLWGAIFTFWGN